MEDGDVLLLMDGRMLRVEAISKIGDASTVTYLDKDTDSYTDLDKLHVEKNLGQSTNVLATFYATRSIHLRLNRMNKI